MVGFFSSPTIDGAIKEEKRGLTTHLLSDPKSLSIPNDPLDFCQPEPEDVPSSFVDSFFDFDSINGWLMEGNPELCVDPENLADLGANPVDFESSGDGISKKDAVEDLLGLDHEKEESRVVEKSLEMVVCEKISQDGPVSGGDGPGSDLGCLIEEKLGKVSLGGEGSNGNSTKANETVGDKDESDDNSEDEGSSSSSSDSSSSSGEEDDEDSEATRGNKKSENEEQTDLEEGEILLSDTEGLVGWSDNEDESVMTGPIKSKNELTVLPPVPSVSVTLEPHHQALPVGVLLSIVGAQVIVEGVEKHSPLSEGSILWITESRLPLGIIDEIFGPVKNPYYIVRYNSEDEIPSGIEQGTLISFVQEFANHVLNDKSLYQKGYDASGEHDEELSDELEFSDDEKEAEYRKMIKMKKRGTANESKPVNKRKEKRRQRNLPGNWNHNQGLAPQSSPLSTQDQHSAPPNAASLNQMSSSRSSGPNQGSPFPYGPQAPGFAYGPRPDMAGNQAMVPPFPNGPGFVPPNGTWNNGFPQQQNMGLPNGLPGNGMLWMQQNGFPFFQAPLQMNMAFQQQMGSIPGLPLNFNNGLGGQPNFVGGPMLTTSWPTNLAQFGMGMQGQHVPLNGGGGDQGGQQSQGPQNSLNSQQGGQQSQGVGGPMLTTPWPTNPAQFGVGVQGQLTPMNGGRGEHGSELSQGPQNSLNTQQGGEQSQGTQNSWNSQQGGQQPQGPQNSWNSQQGNQQSQGTQNSWNSQQGGQQPQGPQNSWNSQQGNQQSQGPQNSWNSQQGGQQSQGPQKSWNSQPSTENSNPGQGRGGGGGGRRGGHHRDRGRFGRGRGRFQSR